MFAGLGMYCLGGIIVGLVLAVIIGVAISRQQIEAERLERERQVRLLALERDEDEYLAASRLRLREMKARQKA